MNPFQMIHSKISSELYWEMDWERWMAERQIGKHNLPHSRFVSDSIRIPPRESLTLTLSSKSKVQQIVFTPRVCFHVLRLKRFFTTVQRILCWTQTYSTRITSGTGTHRTLQSVYRSLSVCFNRKKILRGSKELSGPETLV